MSISPVVSFNETANGGAELRASVTTDEWGWMQDEMERQHELDRSMFIINALPGDNPTQKILEDDSVLDLTWDHAADQTTLVVKFPPPAYDMLRIVSQAGSEEETAIEILKYCLIWDRERANALEKKFLQERGWFPKLQDKLGGT